MKARGAPSAPVRLFTAAISGRGHSAELDFYTKLHCPQPTARGNAAERIGAGSWSAKTYDFTFATYVDSSGGAPSGGGSEAASVPNRTLQLQSDSRCATQQASSLDGQWLQLPSAEDCTRAGHTLLGWSTSAAFPVAVAKAQIDKGWGAIDYTLDGVRMIFIPAAGYTLLSGDNTLYAVWGPST